MTWRRSAAGAAVGGADGLPSTPAGAAWSGVPHSPQNFCPGTFAAPHDVHTAASAVPHSPQNFWPGAFSAPQLEQEITCSNLDRSGPKVAFAASVGR